VTNKREPTVVLLHGLGRTHRSLAGLRRRLEREGYPTWSRTYPSRAAGVIELAKTVEQWIRSDLGDVPVLGVTHSLGGVIARHLHDRLNWQGLVMLAPPNTGSRVARGLESHPLYRFFLGPAGLQLASPKAWPPPPHPFAVIAGTQGPSIGNLPSWVIHSMRLLPKGEPNDGTLTVAETRFEGMDDFAEVSASHTGIMNHPQSQELILRFLNAKHF